MQTKWTENSEGRGLLLYIKYVAQKADHLLINYENKEERNC
jgi:hypothetical protein